MKGVLDLNVNLKKVCGFEEQIWRWQTCKLELKYLYNVISGSKFMCPFENSHFFYELLSRISVIKR